ncbi:MAG: DUF2244 domain-containing protein [Burkholderiaceae bacterium]|jgi:uncharacterized membrane protein|nr:DUF2244 domain-containing protein [Burkholderiaceae bacterium]MCU0929349.1 DUF2244 domain-containing protein [Burkholderiaceae bacterium]
MSASIAPPLGPWAGASAPWRVGRLDADGRGAVQWVLRRNCSMTPCQLLAVYLSLCAVSIAIATMFWLHGATVVLAFAGAELLAVGIALLCYARHAGDRETITLDGHRLSVEHVCGSRVERQEFGAAWLRVGAPKGHGSLVELSAEGRTARVGRYLRPEWRPALAHELRRTLVAMPVAGAAGDVQ